MKYFSSEIKGKRITDFQQYDPSLSKYDDRLDLVGKMINKENGELHEFFGTYFSNYYDVSPSQNGMLSEQDAVCKAVEGLGTYLLNAKDIESNRKVKYRFWRSEREFKQYKESANVLTSTLEAGVEEGVEVVDLFFSNEDKNYKLSTDQRLFARDLRDVKEIAALQGAIEKAGEESFILQIERHIDKSLSSIEYEQDRSRLITIRKNVPNYVRRYIRDMKENQILIKEAVKRPIRNGNTLKLEDSLDRLDEVLMSDAAGNKALMLMLGEEEDLMSDIGIMIYDFNNLINRMTWSEREQELIKLLRQGYKQKELPDIMSINRRTVSDLIGRVSKKIAEFYVKDLYKKTINKG